jgi:hypothetical protein
LIKLSADHPILAIRLDPGQSAGQIRLSSIRLNKPDKTTLREWTFKGQATK